MQMRPKVRPKIRIGHNVAIIYPFYQGKCDKKAETYHKYKFAICFENMKNIKGYVTEKILDCLTAGIVPVYAGADNIEEYVFEDFVLVGMNQCGCGCYGIGELRSSLCN